MIFRFLNFFLLSITVLFLISSCNEADKLEIERSAAAFDLEQGVASIKQSNELFMKSFEKGDTASVASCYTSNAHLMIADTPAIEGRADVQEFISGMMEKGVNEFNLSSEHIWGDSTMLVEVGDYILKSEKDKQLDKGKYIALWQQEAGNWRIYRHMWNSDLPEAEIKLEKVPASDK